MPEMDMNYVFLYTHFDIQGNINNIMEQCAKGGQKRLHLEILFNLELT